jgi:uncharacterized protein YjiK
MNEINTRTGLQKPNHLAVNWPCSGFALLLFSVFPVFSVHKNVVTSMDTLFALRSCFQYTCRYYFIVFRFFLLFICLCSLVVLSYAQKGGTAAVNIGGTMSRYNLSAPEVFSLPLQLSEISGISYHKAGPAVYAVDDEQGNVFSIRLEKEPVVEQWAVSGKQDYEDIVFTGNSFYLLTSPGSIVHFPSSFPVIKLDQASRLSKGKSEYEILLKDPAADRLLMMCKSCRDDKKGEVSVYGFQLATGRFSEEPVAVLQVKEIDAVLKEKVGNFRPSAANVHPLTGEIYIVSSINHLLVVTDSAFRVREVHKLDATIFKQPEGLCFTPSGDLLISNEAAGRGSANILLFRQNL